MKNVFFALVVGLILSGCTLFENDALRGKINSAVADALVMAWETGGDVYTEKEIDKMVAEGKLTPEQASQLKAKIEQLGSGIVEYLKQDSQAQQ